MNLSHEMKKSRLICLVSVLGLGAMLIQTIILAGTPRVGSAQTGSGSPPPTYDYNDTVPGVQGPTAPTTAGAENRVLRTFVVTVPVLVPLADLQAVLPPGFNAVANPAGSNTGQVTVFFNFQERNTRIADGQTFGGSAMLFQFSMVNTNLVPNRTENGIPVREVSSQELVDYYNATYGAGTARLAKVNMQVTEDGGTLSFKSTVTDDALGLSVSVQATAPGALISWTKTDPGNINRFLISQRAYFTSNLGDSLAVPRAMANFKFDTPGGQLQVPVAGGGSRSLTISGFGANITFLRNLETFAKNE